MTNPFQQLADTGEDSPQKATELLPLLYSELKRLAASKLSKERGDHSLQATALVHEAYLRITNSDHETVWANPGHFFGAAAEAMRRILINHARDRGTCKRGKGWQRISLKAVDISVSDSPEKFLLLNEAFENLADKDPKSADVARLRIFAGMTIQEASEITGIPLRTVDRLWAFSRVWLRNHIKSHE
ncbi:ECF-type sigma factor [Pirellulaceae bacterium]|nr:ECF-type sigma factor [Pirellulaceae bacterium]